MSKRKKYRPKPVLQDPLSLLRPASAAQRTGLMLRFSTALHELTTGQHPGLEEWRDLSDAVNTIETLSLTMGKLVPGEVMPVVNSAVEGMVSASKRWTAGQGMRLDSAGLLALRQVVEIYGQCLDGLTEREMACAQALTQQRVNEIRKRGPTQGAVVVEI